MVVRLNAPTSVHVDVCGNIFICDTLNFRIRFVPKVSGNYFGQNNLQANYLYTIAGSGNPDSNVDQRNQRILATTAMLNMPTNCVTDNQGNLYFIDYNNARICQIEKNTGFINPIYRI